MPMERRNDIRSSVLFPSQIINMKHTMPFAPMSINQLTLRRNLNPFSEVK